MIYLVLYDEFNNCQRVATADNASAAQPFYDAGFIQVTEDEYNRCAAIVDTARLTDLTGLIAALQLLQSLRSGGGTQQTPPPEIDRDKVEKLIAQFARNSQKRTADLFAGTIDSDQWFNAMAAQIKRNRLAARAIGAGGFQNLTEDDIASAQRAARRELTYLTEFRKALENGTISEKQALVRVAQYGGGAREQAERGFQDAIGLPALPAQPGVRTQCHKNCKCSWRIDRLPGAGNFNCDWIRSPVDSCDTCKRREQVFNPLQIRNGIIQPYSTSGIYA